MLGVALSGRYVLCIPRDSIPFLSSPERRVYEMSLVRTKKYTTIRVIAVLGLAVTSLLLYLIFRFAPSALPLVATFSETRVKILDEEGAPVSGALVHWTYGYVRSVGWDRLEWKEFDGGDTMSDGAGMAGTPGHSFVIGVGEYSTAKQRIRKEFYVRANGFLPMTAALGGNYDKDQCLSWFYEGAKSKRVGDTGLACSNLTSSPADEGSVEIRLIRLPSCEEAAARFSTKEGNRNVGTLLLSEYCFREFDRKFAQQPSLLPLVRSALDLDPSTYWFHGDRNVTVACALGFLEPHEENVDVLKSLYNLVKTRFSHDRRIDMLDMAFFSLSRLLKHDPKRLADIEKDYIEFCGHHNELLSEWDLKFGLSCEKKVRALEEGKRLDIAHRCGTVPRASIDSK